MQSCRGICKVAKAICKFEEAICTNCEGYMMLLKVIIRLTHQVTAGAWAEPGNNSYLGSSAGALL